ncbi:CLUMA_CG020833, isoform A [Clunio marinus]|uniref:CLUMA_CG020833, isoform A n=1 Tax=Clunio marinus TaxID=568069 RepID=A0A1J1J6V4_9DIPT|nr:CLUMA_CG020833, isoform A [Clunio marinus]
MTETNNTDNRMPNSTNNLENGNRKGNILELETDKEREERLRSLWIIYFTMFLISLGFSIVLTGIWPYLDKLDPQAGKEFMGFIVAANPLGQMIFSPIFGWWSNKITSIRMPLLVSMAIFCVSSALYSSLDLFENDFKYWMFIARFFVGVSSANIAVCRSYVSAATTLKERTNGVSMMSLAQVLGFVIGPALQAVVTPLGAEGFLFMNFTINMYTASGWCNVLLGIINFLMFLPCFFKDRRIAAREQMILQGKSTEKETWKSIKPDYATSWTLILSFFVIVFNFVLLETLGSSLTMDQFAWSKSEALYYVGILMSVGAFIACIAFCLIAPLSQRYKESNVLIWGGFFTMVIGRLIFMPYRDEYPRLALDREYMMENGTIGFYSDDDEHILGCPVSTQPWCSTTPVLGFPEFIIGYILSSIGYPIGVTLIQTIFSKILGSRPQGVWMGLFTAGGCVSRIMGPVAVGSIYTRYGTSWTFGITCGMMVLPMIWLYILRHRLDVDSVDVSVEMENLKKDSNGVTKSNGSNGLIKDKSVIINESTTKSEREKFLSEIR